MAAEAGIPRPDAAGVITLSVGWKMAFGSGGETGTGLETESKATIVGTINVFHGPLAAKVLTLVIQRVGAGQCASTRARRSTACP